MKQFNGDIKEIDTYIDEIDKFVCEIKNKAGLFLNSENTKIKLILDGEASKTARERLPIEFRRKNGIYFTSSKIAQKVAERIDFTNRKIFRIYDPCVGAGNLLIPLVKKIIKEKNLINSNESLKFFNKTIIANDIFHSLVNLTKLRLALLITSEIGHINIGNINELFSNITIDDSLKIKKLIKETDIVVINPPFVQITADNNCTWTTGKVQEAAVLIESIILRSTTGTEIIAILPDVLRSGSRYEKWRNLIKENTHIIKEEIIGRFDKYTDVDVYLLHMRVQKKKVELKKEKMCIISNQHTVEDFFDVKVGTVVPFRNKHIGKLVPYLTCKESIWWQKTIEFAKVKFEGTLFQPPFIAIRRTSSPSEQYRAYATLVKGKSKIAVENHLIVLTPKNGSEKICKELLLILQDDRTNIWLNKKIRCRHLTLNSIKKLPWWG